MADTGPITRLNAALEGRYRIDRELGAGGMATVYLAEDVRHRRNVALKVLKPELAAVVGADRFLAEIETTAKLQHPHILPLFDSGEAEGFLFYVMPYVEGESLRERLAREHQLPVDEAVAISSKVASALDYAHNRGVIHRDVKPANILLNETGEPLVSDFGIALALSAGGGDRLTETGLSLGTPHYMSPEQATGDLSVGPPADVWGLGCILYEMLAGEPPFTGSTPQAVLGKIIAGEVSSVSEARPSVPVNVASVIAKALERVPADRFRSASGFERALHAPGFDYLSDRPGTEGAPRWKRPIIGWATAMTILALAALWNGWSANTDRAVSPRKFSTLVPDSQRPVGGVAVSPDGSQVIIEGGSGDARHLFVRSLDQSEANPIRGTSGARDPFFSPDGQWVGFFSQGSLMKVSLENGDLRTIAESVDPTFDGASWGHGDDIVMGARRGGLFKVSAAGGTPVRLSAPDEGFGELGHASPSILPGGDAVLFTVITGMDWDATHVEVMSLSTTERRVVTNEGANPRYAPTGHVIYEMSGSLYALSFDPVSFEATGEPAPVLEGSGAGGFVDVADFGFSDAGTLAFVASGGRGRADTLLWVDRSGRPTPILSSASGLQFPHLSPDAARVALTTFGTELETWITELDRPGLSRLTFEGNNHLPVWTPDGERIVFSSDRDGSSDLYWRRSDGGGEAELLYASPQHKDAGSWSPDGSVMTFAQASPDTDWDIWVLYPDSTARARPLIQTRFSEHTPMISPDGRWLAYTSNESGRFEVYVTPFPDVGPKVQASLEGAGEPLWRPDGRELFYRTGDSVMAARVVADRDFDVDTPRLLFRGNFAAWEGLGYPGYDVTPDGQRFLMIKPSEGEEGATQLHFVLNWFDELRSRMGDDR